MGDMINLNDDNFDVSSNIIFNEGKAGKVDNVSIRVEKKSSTDTTNSPNWKLYAKDPQGGEVNAGYYYLDIKHANYKKQLMYQGAALKHLLHAVAGDDVQIPEFSTPVEMLDRCMASIAKVPENMKFRIAVSYGTQNYPSIYLRIKNFPEFIEPMSVPEEKSRIVLSGSYLMERPVPNKEEDTGFGTSSIVVTTDVTTADPSGFEVTPEEENSDLPF